MSAGIVLDASVVVEGLAGEGRAAVWSREMMATPGEGYMFDQWSGDQSGSPNPEFITMDNDKTLTAIFIEIPLQALGNLNKDTEVDLEDAILGLQVITGNETSVVYESSMDVNIDDKIGLEEVLYILQE